MNQQEIESIVEEVMQQFDAPEGGFGGGATARTSTSAVTATQEAVQAAAQTAAKIRPYLREFPAMIEAQRQAANTGGGVFATIDEAVVAAEEAFHALAAMTLEERGEIIRAIRRCALANAKDFAERTLEETGMGRVEHKQLKFEIVARKTPGVEILRPECFTGDHGMTVDELAPFGVIGAVTPSTHPLPTLVNNAISFIAAGNTGVFNAHPATARVFAYGVQKFNESIVAAGGPPSLITCTSSPTIETGKQLFAHPRVRLLLVTGGGAVVREAMRAPKRAICAGPGNPPVVVDETADLFKAAQSIIAGGGFDNNILCIGEKEVFVVDKVADALIKEMCDQGCHLLNAEQIEALTRVAFTGDSGQKPSVNRSLMGKNASVLAEAAGLTVTYDPPLLIGETAFDHPFVQKEQMMPFMPIVRCRNTTEAISMAIEAEHGYGHTAVIHSRNIQNMHDMAKRVNTTLFVKNGASTAALAWGGEGYTSFSIATPTGEGCTTARTFTRYRRCSLVDYFRIV